MAKALLVMTAVALVGVIAEPPVGRQYLPPGQGGGGHHLSTQYGAPLSRGGGGGGLNTRYGAPSRSHGGFSQGGGFGGFSSPSTQYGAPSSRNFGGFRGGVPSNQYGAPNRGGGIPSQQYGAPSAFGAAASSLAPSAQYGAPFGGGSRNGGGYARGGGAFGGEDQYNEPANYQFSWEVNDPQSGNDFGHEESRQGDNAEGKYYVLLPDGRRQIVEYTADQEGYKPMIRYEGEAYNNNAGSGYPRGGGGGRSGGHFGPQGPY